MSSPSSDRVREVFEQWEMYEAIIRHNYMLHADLPPRLNQLFSAQSRPLSVLDLGCGDGFMARESLKNLEISSYRAIDLSAEALQRLDAGTPHWEGRKTLHQGDFSTTLPTIPANTFDIVLANYSLHHLSQEQKRLTLGEIDRVLSATGLFVWTDVVLDEQETREDYLSRLDQIMQNWTGLTPSQRERGIEHIWESDFPEKQSWMMAQMEGLGWSDWEEFIRDATFGAWVFRKPLVC